MKIPNTKICLGSYPWQVCITYHSMKSIENIGRVSWSVLCEVESVWGRGSGVEVWSGEGVMGCPRWRAVCSLTSCTSLTQNAIKFWVMMLPGFSGSWWCPPPADNSKINDTGNHRLAEDLMFLCSTWVEPLYSWVLYLIASCDHNNVFTSDAICLFFLLLLWHVH